MLLLLSFSLLNGCAQMEKETGTAIEDASKNAKTLPENIWK
jgi:hypothetical protein